MHISMCMPQAGPFARHMLAHLMYVEHVESVRGKTGAHMLVRIKS
jgi:hypothetical protein